MRVKRINGVVAMLKREIPKIIQVNDLINWFASDELNYSPKYQRNNVWNEKAKSYLIDTIVRGLPIPPIFMRQSIDVSTRKTHREIIDGQQRVRTIIDFVNDKFVISKTHNDECGGLLYSELDDEVKGSILGYDIFVEIINETEDTIIYDMFARLNTNNCVLNSQELRNSKYWGEFKVAAYSNAAEYRELFEQNNIFSDKQFSRMIDVEFISSLLNVVINGIDKETQTSLNKLYEKYDKSFNDYDQVKSKFDKVMSVIKSIYEYLNNNVVCFTSKTYFYTLFAVIYHQMFGLSGLNREMSQGMPQSQLYSYENINNNLYTLFEKIVEFENAYNECVKQNNSNHALYLTMDKFSKHHKTRTTDKTERLERIKILNNFILGE